MPRYEELEHTADLRVRIYGRDRPELFCNASWALAELLAEVGEPGAGSERTLSLEGAPDYPMLLVDFLSELLYLWEVEESVFVIKDLIELSPRGLRATLVGLHPKRVRREIKAVTYHGLEVGEAEGGFEATVLFDI